jgi:hypothetical protein
MAKELLVQAAHRLRRIERRGAVSPAVDGAPSGEEARLATQFLACSGFATSKAVGPAPASVLRALNRAERRSDTSELSRLHAYVAVMAAVTPLKVVGRGYVRLAERAGGPGDAWATFGRMHVSLWTGDLDAALRCAVESHDRFLAMGLRRAASEAVCIAGFAALWAGDFASCETVARAMWEDCGIDENEQMQAYSAIARALTCLATGQDDEAARLVALLASLDSSRVAPQERAFRVAVAALAGHLRGEDVRSQLDEVTSLMSVDAMPAVPGRWQVYGTLAGVGLERELLLGEARRPSTTFGLRGLRRYARTLPVARSASLRWSGVDASIRGRRRLADRRWEKSLRVARQLGMRHQEALTLLAMGQATAAAGREGAEPLTARAAEQLREIGAHGDARRAEAILASVAPGRSGS